MHPANITPYLISHTTPEMYSHQIYDVSTSMIVTTRKKKSVSMIMIVITKKKKISEYEFDYIYQKKKLSQYEYEYDKD